MLCEDHIELFAVLSQVIFFNQREVQLRFSDEIAREAEDWQS
jgi:hypothetical protein